MEPEEKRLRPVMYVRVLPEGSDEWIAHTKWDSILDGRLARDILKKTNHFKGVELISQFQLEWAEGGLQSVVIAETQIAGAWTHQEQTQLRIAVSKARYDYNRPGRLLAQRRMQMWRWAEDGITEIFELLGEIMKIDPTMGEGTANNNVLPPRMIKKIREGETNARTVIRMRNPR